VNVLAGYLAARFVREHGTSRSTIVRLLLAGAICVGLALWWDTVFPINKKIWTSSFVLCTVGIDLVVLAILICLVPEDAGASLGVFPSRRSAGTRWPSISLPSWDR